MTSARLKLLTLLATVVTSSVLAVLFAESEGRRVLVALAVPVFIALVPVLTASRVAGWVAAGGLTLCVMLGAASIGLLYVPAMALAWMAASR